MLDKHRNNEHVGDVAAADAELMFFRKTISIFAEFHKKRKKKKKLK